MGSVHVLDKTFLCHDRFCPNCQKMIQATHLARFSPVLDSFADNYAMYHVTFTVPNCNGDKLKGVIDNFLGNFKRFIQYINYKQDKKNPGKIKPVVRIAGLSFEWLGFHAALRALEITLPHPDEFHPHIHAVFVLDKSTLSNPEIQNKYIENRFSKSYKAHNDNLLFSEFEIDLQKIWRLLMDGRKVTKAAIDAMGVNDGYSCIVSPIRDGDYYEVFKYVLKSFCDNGQFMSYDSFKTLRDVLHGRKVIQGYGALYGLKCDEKIDTANERYFDCLIELLKREYGDPEKITLAIDELQYKQRLSATSYFVSGKRLYLADLSGSAPADPDELDKILALRDMLKKLGAPVPESSPLYALFAGLEPDKNDPLYGARARERAERHKAAAGSQPAASAPEAPSAPEAVTVTAAPEEILKPDKLEDIF